MSKLETRDYGPEFRQRKDMAHGSLGRSGRLRYHCLLQEPYDLGSHLCRLADLACASSPRCAPRFPSWANGDLELHRRAGPPSRAFPPFAVKFRKGPPGWRNPSEPAMFLEKEERNRLRRRPALPLGYISAIWAPNVKVRTFGPSRYFCSCRHYRARFAYRIHVTSLGGSVSS